MLELIRRCWKQSKFYRRILSITIVYCVVRLLMHLMLLSGTVAPGADAYTALPDDLRIYLEAAGNLQQQAELYPPLPLERMEFYQYAPSFALAFTPFWWLPVPLTALVHTLLHIAVYVLLYRAWGRIFKRLEFTGGAEMLAWTLPVWLVFAPFWGDLSYLNVYLFMALLASLLIEAVLAERLGWSLIWLAIILQIKPQWAFALAIPLLTGQHRFFVKLVVGSIISYVFIAGVTILVVGTSYGFEQYGDYFHLLTGIGGNYPWRTPDMPFLGYNHSIAQAAVYWLGPDAFGIATVVKALILAPLAVLGLRCIVRPPDAEQQPNFRLDLAFALYTAAFIWLDVVWEVSLSIAIFTYLLATMQGRNSRILIWAVFLPYALVDAWQLLSYIIFGDAVIAPGPYVLTDPSIYVPLTMVVTVVFYVLLVKRLWAAVGVVQPAAISPQNLPINEVS